MVRRLRTGQQPFPVEFARDADWVISGPRQTVIGQTGEPFPGQKVLVAGWGSAAATMPTELYCPFHSS